MKNKEKKIKVKKEKRKNKKVKKDIRKPLLKVLVILLIVDIIFIPLFIYAEVKPLVGMCVFIFFPLVLAALTVFLSRSCYNSYESKKKMIEEKLNR